MQNFIVLGIIPGTDIQISFTAWLLSCLSGLLITWLYHERHALRVLALATYVAFLIKRHHLA